MSRSQRGRTATQWIGAMAEAMRAAGATHAERHKTRPDGTQEHWVMTLGPAPRPAPALLQNLAPPEEAPLDRNARKAAHYYDLFNRPVSEEELALYPDVGET